MNIFSLVGSIMVDSSAADSSLHATDTNAQSVGKTFVKGVGTAAKWGVGVVLAGAAAVGSLIAVASKAASTAASIDDMAQRTNLSSKTLQEFGYAAEQSGTSMEVIEKGAIKLTKTMAAYKAGNKGTIEAFKQLGLSAEDSNGKLKSTDEMYPQIIAKLAGMKDITERNALSMELFGKSGAELGPLLNEGTAGIEAMKAEAGKLGLVLSDETIAAGAKFDDEMAKVTASLGAVTTKIGLGLMPIVSAMLSWVTTNMPTIQAVAGTAFDLIKLGVSTLGDIINNILIPAFKNTQGAIETAINWVVQFKDILIPLGVGILAGALIFGIYTLAINAHTLAITIATGATTAFGAVMAFITSPIGIVVLAIGALIAIFVLAYNNIEGFRNIIDSAWSFIQTKTQEIFGNYIMPFIRDQLMPLFQRVFSTIGDVVKGSFTVMVWAWNFVLKPIFVILMFYIQNILVPAWKLAFSVIGGAVSSVFSTIGSLWNNSLKPIFNGILDFVSGVFTGNWRKAWGGIVSIFSGIWAGIKTIAKAPINFIIGGLNGFINGINKIKIPDWVPGLGGKGFSIPHIPSFAVGSRSLPSDMLINAHKGEMIVPRKENPYENSGGKILPSQSNNAGIALTITNFYNDSKQSIEDIAEELQYYIKQKSLGGTN